MQAIPHSGGICAALVAGFLLSGCSADPAVRLDDARTAFAAGDLRKATVQLKSLLQDAPNKAAARQLLGEVMLASGEIPAAERELRLAVKLGHPAGDVALPLARALFAQGRLRDLVEEIPASSVSDSQVRAALLAVRGDAYLGLGDTAAAEREYSTALEQEPQSIAALLGLAYAAAAGGGNDRSRQFLDRAYATRRERPLVDLAAAELAQRRADTTRAAELYGSLLAQADLAPALRRRALTGLVETHLATGDLDAARKRVAELQRLTPNDPQAQYLLARLHFVGGEFVEARSVLQQLLARAPGHASARLLLGAVNLAKGHLGQADQELVAVLAEDASNLLARRLLAEARLRQDQPDRALDALRAGDGASGSLLPLAAAASYAAGDPAAALSLLEKGAAAASDDPEQLMSVAAGYANIGRLEESIGILDRVRTAPGDLRGGLMLVAARLRAGDARGASSLAAKLVREHPDAASAHGALGAALVEQRQYDAAAQSLERAAALDAKAIEPQLDLARLDLLRKRPNAAQSRLLALRERAPTDLRVPMELARTAYAQGQLPAAVEALQRAQREHPDALPPRLMLARLHLAAGDAARALAVAQDAVRIAPEEPAALSALGLAQAISGQQRASIATLETLARLRPRAAGVHYTLARLHLLAGDRVAASRALAVAERLDPSFAPAIALRASIAVAENDSGTAQRSIERLREARPASGAAEVLEGDLALRRGQANEALSKFASAARRAPSAAVAVREFRARQAAGMPDAIAPLQAWIAEHPDDVSVLLVLATAQQESGAAADAARTYEALLSREPAQPVALNNYAWLLAEQGDARALGLARRAHEAARGEPRIADTYGWLLLQSGDTKGALPLLAGAAKALPADASVQFRYASALARAGQTKASTAILAALLASDRPFPERDRARRLLDDLSKGAAGAASG